MSAFSRDWLRLRESADLAARNADLARRFAAALTRGEAPVRLADLGAGSGANARALLPRIGVDQEWHLIDHDRDLIAAQSDEFTIWARRQGYPIRAGGGRIIMNAGAAQWHLASLPLDLMREQDAIAALDVDGVTTAALLDLVSLRWIEWLAALLAQRRAPLLAALTVDGRRLWKPELSEDAIVAASFRQHQTRDKGFGPALGADAPQALARALATKDFAVTIATSDWPLGPRDRVLLLQLIADEARAAREAAPHYAGPIASWEEQRRDQLSESKLWLTVGHCDMLALPG